jgi:ribonuclease D
MEFRLIADGTALAEAAGPLGSASRIALDCEAAGFHRYSDRLCLLQLSTETDTFLFDPLAVDPSEALRPLLEDPSIPVVMHGADYDLRLLDRDLGIRLRGLFDTQVAALLLGASALGLAALLEEHLGVALAKQHQRADWAQRPLPPDMLAYAAADTVHLLGLADLLSPKLAEMGRDGWAREEFRLLEEVHWEEEPADPLTRVKGARDLNPRQATALRAGMEWRDRIARERDRAPFRVVSDAALLAVAVDPPSSLDGLAAQKGVSPQLARHHGRELLEELRRVERLPEAALVPYPRASRNGRGRPTPEEDLLSDRLRGLRTARAADLGVERGVLLSNTQIAEVVRLRPATLDALRKVPGMRRWQTELLGEEILGILA